MRPASTTREALGREWRGLLLWVADGGLVASHPAHARFLQRVGAPAPRLAGRPAASRALGLLDLISAYERWVEAREGRGRRPGRRRATGALNALAEAQCLGRYAERRAVDGPGRRAWDRCPPPGHAPRRPRAGLSSRPAGSRASTVRGARPPHYLSLDPPIGSPASRRGSCGGARTDVRGLMRPKECDRPASVGADGPGAPTGADHGIASPESGPAVDRRGPVRVRSGAPPPAGARVRSRRPRSRASDAACAAPIVAPSG